jgi:hypothetical protein
VAGIAALILSANPSLSAARLKTLLTEQVGRTIGGSDASGAVDASLVVARAQSENNVARSMNSSHDASTLANSSSVDDFFASSGIS